MAYAEDFEKALQVGRPPNIKALFPNSKALIVSGKVIDRAMRAKGKAIAMAANGRNYFVIRGALRGGAAGQRRRSSSRSPSPRAGRRPTAPSTTGTWRASSTPSATRWASPSRSPSTPTTTGSRTTRTWPPPRSRSRPCSRRASRPSPSTLRTCPTTRTCSPTSPSTPSSRSGPASRPRSARSRGKTGFPPPDEALFLIQGLNAHDIFPDWIALNNGTTHGIEASDAGIQVGLTAEIHNALTPYKVSGAQHGTSGNSSERLREIAAKTAHHQGQRGHRPADDLLGAGGERLRQRAARRRRQLHQGARARG